MYWNLAVPSADILRYDILNAYVSLSPPRIAAAFTLEETLTLRTWPQDEPAKLLASQLGHGFTMVHSSMPQHACYSRLQQVTQAFVAMIIDFDQIQRHEYDKSRTDLPNEMTVIWIRSMLMHELMMLPETLILEERDGEHEAYALTYEMCRLACLLFCQAWGFPDCNWNRRQAQKLVFKLVPLLARATVGKSPHKFCKKWPDFYNWILVLGFMLAYEDFDLFSDDRCMMALLPYWAHSVIKPQREAWSIVYKTLSGFFWRWPECDITGEEAWNYACDLSDIT